jgi:hypothetical protein
MTVCQESCILKIQAAVFVHKIKTYENVKQFYFKKFKKNTCKTKTPQSPWLDTSRHMLL